MTIKTWLEKNVEHLSGTGMIYVMKNGFGCSISEALSVFGDIQIHPKSTTKTSSNGVISLMWPTKSGSKAEFIKVWR